MPVPEVSAKCADEEKQVTKEFVHANLNEYLHGYYQFVFPHNLFHRWLSYGNVKKDYFENREFSFTLAGDIYLRYNSFDNAADMRKAINSRLPTKIDIGAVYSSKPKDSKRTKSLLSQFNFSPVERELVFDIDMTDYDDVRTCCQGTAICARCWPFMVIAARILEATLRDDFGFRNLLLVYSGRRGIHCWVADERARRLGPHARESIANYINIFDGGHFKAKKVEIDGFRGVHPALTRAIRIIDSYFDDFMIAKQDFLSTRAQIEAITDLCADEMLRQELRTYMLDPKLRNSAERWTAFVKISQSFYRQNRTLRHSVHKHRFLVQEVKLQLCYPRLDINVTKGLNHLLKVPYSVHPKTGRICVPVAFDEIDQFDPFSVPTVDQLCAQIDEIDRSNDKRSGEAGESEKEMAPIGGSSRLTEMTSLAPSLAVFRDFIHDIEATQQGALIAKSDQTLMF